MKLHFFINDKSNSEWHHVHMEAWIQTGINDTSEHSLSRFLLLESLRVHISKNPTQTESHHRYHSANFEHQFFEDSCHGHFARSFRDFRDDRMKKSPDSDDNNKLVSQAVFQRVKTEFIEVYRSYPAVDYRKIRLSWKS